jgi:hypothetical protein
MIGDDLSRTALTQCKGLLCAAGYSGGVVYFERSDDDGATITGERVAIGSSDDQQPALAVLSTAEVIVGIVFGGSLYAYRSGDFGATWAVVETLSA